jgi:hypothetical protein
MDFVFPCKDHFALSVDNRKTFDCPFTIVRCRLGKETVLGFFVPGLAGASSEAGFVSFHSTLSSGLGVVSAAHAKPARVNAQQRNS